MPPVSPANGPSTGYRVLATTKDLAIALRDAERSQRGYLLTGWDDYLGLYN